MTNEKATIQIVEPEEIAVVRQQLSKHVFLATYKHATMEKLLEVVFSVVSVQSLYSEL
jgi:hypothetical protein